MGPNVESLTFDVIAARGSKLGALSHKCDRGQKTVRLPNSKTPFSRPMNGFKAVCTEKCLKQVSKIDSDTFGRFDMV